MSGYTLRKHAFILFVGKFLATALMFVVPLVLVRVLSKNEFGIYKQAMLLVTFFTSMLQFGITQSLYFFYSHGDDNRKLISQTFYIFLFIAALFFLLYWAFSGYIPSLIKGLDTQGVIRNTGIYIGLFFLTFFFETLLILERQPKKLLLFLVLDNSARTGFAIIFAFIYNDVSMILFGLILYGLIKLAVVVIYLSANYGFPMGMRGISRADVMKQVRYAVPLGGGRLIGDIGRKADRFILTAFLSASGYAVYTVGTLRMPLDIAYLSIGNTALPRITEYYREGRKDLMAQLWHKVIFYYCLFTIPIVIFCEGFADEIITFLFTDEYIEAAAVFRVYVLIYLGYMMARGSILKASNNTRYAFSANLYSMISGVALGIVLIRYFGIMGGAASAVLASSVNVFYQVYKSKKILNLSFGKWLPWKRMIIITLLSAAAMVPALGIRLLTGGNIYRLMAGFAIYSLVLIPLMNWFRLISISSITSKIREKIEGVKR
ncbi:MAG: oligosaccharide flippase family protein [Candidatus Latescibacteria bacterium]|nr:oligosaccharide flippase family protein [bacterium]MBD3424785.1 oligosaccharide flippase family protein [Candidatus Latescibacterota bacterium]